jgi:DMSO/TMAO reductase YedYZ molybdopterin-dependent catalytic subunit
MSEPLPARPVVTESPLNAEVAPGALSEPLTSAGAFFVRCHFDVPDPAGAPPIVVDGAVERPLEIRADELEALGPVRTLDVTLECAGNSRTLFDPRPPGTPWGDGAVSTARWEGVPLALLLDRAGPRPGAVEVLFEGRDAGTTRAGTREPYARSLAPDVARHPDTLLVTRMNGAPLPAEHGAPVRLLVPGWYGMASVKWLRRITLLEEPFAGFFQADDYVFRDHPELPDGTPVTRILPNSRILSPAGGAGVPAGPVVVRGIAWAGRGPVARVEVSLDGGATWADAELAEAASPYAARAWQLEGHLAPGEHVLASRAHDAVGDVQPASAPWNALGYASNPVRSARIVAR